MKETNVWNNTNLLKILPLYNILIEKPKIKRLSNAKLIYELPFYDSLNIKEISKAFKIYAKSYSIELIQLNASN